MRGEIVSEPPPAIVEIEDLSITHGHANRNVSGSPILRINKGKVIIEPVDVPGPPVLVHLLLKLEALWVTFKVALEERHSPPLTSVANAGRRRVLVCGLQESLHCLRTAFAVTIRATSTLAYLSAKLIYIEAERPRPNRRGRRNIFARKLGWHGIRMQNRRLLIGVGWAQHSPQKVGVNLAGNHHRLAVWQCDWRLSISIKRPG